MSFKMTLQLALEQNLIPEGEMAVHIFRMSLFLGALSFKFSPLYTATCEVTFNNSEIPFSSIWTGLS